MFFFFYNSFLFNDKNPVAKYYQTQLENLKHLNTSASSSSSSLPSSSTVNPITVKTEGASTSFMSEFEKAKALVRAKAAAMMHGGVGAVGAIPNVVSEEEKKRQKAIEEQKMVTIILRHVSL